MVVELAYLNLADVDSAHSGLAELHLSELRLPKICFADGSAKAVLDGYGTLLMAFPRMTLPEAGSEGLGTVEISLELRFGEVGDSWATNPFVEVKPYLRQRSDTPRHIAGGICGTDQCY